MVSNTRTLNPIVVLALVSCFCWSVGANVITTVPPVADTVAAPPNVVNETTLAPFAAEHASVAPVIHKESVGHNAVVVPVTTTIAPAIVPAHSSAPSHTTSAPHATVITSVKPIVATNATNAEPIVSTGASALAGNAPAKDTHCAGFCDYMKPICESLSKISSKQLFKIQTQFKQFVERTNGKMSMCLVEHYQLDPTFKPVTHEDLNTICASRMQLDGAKGSFQAFQACAANHWDPELDKELALIREARANSTAHQHADSQVAAANIEHEDEELSMINEVVNKVLGQNGNLNKNNSDVKVIDVSGKTTLKPLAANAEQTLITAVDNKSTVAPANKSLLNDPNNTVMVFVDDAKTTLAPAILVSNSTTATPTTIAAAITTVAPSIAVNKTTVAPTHAAHVNSTTLHPAINITTSTIKPTVNSTTHVEVKETHSTNSTTPLPVLSTKAPAANVTTTSKPLIKSTNATTTVAPATTLTPTVNVTITHNSSNGTTTKPTASSSTSTVAPTKIASATTKAAVSTSTVKPTLKPIETLEQILKRQEKQKQDLDAKLKAERTQAINKLKKQDDAKIHQMEHERQMSLDPIGHTIKHQQYEAAKQRKVNSEKQ